MRKTSHIGPYLDLLRRNRDFRRLWTAQLISMGGDWFSTVALLGLVMELTGSELVSGVVLAASRLPFFFFAPITGVIADRFNRRRLMVTADLARAALVLMMLLVRSPETVWIGVVSVAGMSALDSLFMPASQAALPNLVAQKDLSHANALMGASFGTMLAVGAALGGLVSATLGRGTAFVVDSASFVLSAALIVSVRTRFAERRGPTSRLRPIRDIREGIAYARSDGRVTALLLTKAGFGIGAGVIVLLSIFATEVYETGDAGIGLLFAARGLGALLGPIGARAVVGDSQRRLFLAIGASMALFGVAYLAFPLVPTLWLAAPLVTVAHLGGGAQWMLSSYELQRLTPDRVRGRIFAFDFALVTLTLSLSLLGAGAAASVVDPRLVMYSFALTAVAYAAVWTLRTRRFWGRKAEPAPVPVHGQEAPEVPILPGG